ncbi:MAG: hypothetical protein ACRDEB_00230 [Chitinophagaceae bacterium]
MKYSWLLIFLIVGKVVTAQPPLIHAHNDFQRTVPLTNALQYRAYSIEVDVFLVNDTLRVAHDEKDLVTAPTLWDLYLQPIIQLFADNNNRISPDSVYAPVLMIDIKKSSRATLANLVKQLSAFRSVFDRSVNPLAVQIVISGDRPPRKKTEEDPDGELSWTRYPSYIFFDGRPSEAYDKATLKRVAFISDTYYNYVIPSDSIGQHILQLVQQVHSMGKLLRLWATPDSPTYWERLKKWGVDIINTDRMKECREYFSK